MSQSNHNWQQRKSLAIPDGIGITCDFYAEKALNAELWDVEGKRYIDFAAGIAVANTGHCHPDLIAAIKEQLNYFTHTAFQVAPYGSYIELAEHINDLTPGDHNKKTAFFTTGAEALENAVKLARSYTGRTGVVAFSGAFHGRTFMGMALTGKVSPYKEAFGPLPADVFHIPFPSKLDNISTEDSIKALNLLFKADISPKRLAAIVIEPVQGEGGFNVAPPELMQALRKICDEHGIVLIADEVQTGFARTGKMFAIEHSNVVPDLITMAKSLAGGMPLSAVCGRQEIMDSAPKGALGGTYAGNPLAVAAGLAVLKIIAKEDLINRAEQLGQKLKNILQTAKNPNIAEIRGLGAMVAVEFRNPDTNKPDPQTAIKIQQQALDQGLVLLTCGSHGHVIRFLFPLTIPDSVLDEGLAILKESIKIKG